MLEELTGKISQKVDGRETFGFSVKIDLGETGVIFIAGAASPIDVSNGNGAADITFVMSADDLAAMLAGDLPPMSAYAQGKMRIEGDIARAMQFGTMFS